MSEPLSIRFRALPLTRLGGSLIEELRGFDDVGFEHPDEESWLIESESESGESFILRRARWRTPNHAFDDQRPVGSIYAKGVWQWSEGWLSASAFDDAPNLFSALSELLPLIHQEGLIFEPGPWSRINISPASPADLQAWKELIHQSHTPSDPDELALLAAAEAFVLKQLLPNNDPTLSKAIRI